MKTRFLLLKAMVLATIASFGAASGADSPETPKPADAAYQNALVAAIHRLSESRFDDEHLAILLEKHPKLVNERVSYQQPRKPLISDTYTALHFAARTGNDRAVAVLIRYKADVNADGGAGWTPLHIAVQRGDLDICKALVVAGAKVNAKTVAIPAGVAPGSPDPGPGGKLVVEPGIPALTPLDLAKGGKHKDVIEYLSKLK